MCAWSYFNWFLIPQTHTDTYMYTQEEEKQYSTFLLGKRMETEEVEFMRNCHRTLYLIPWRKSNGIDILLTMCYDSQSDLNVLSLQLSCLTIWNFWDF